MDLRVLCVFAAVAYVDVRARITCDFQPRNWVSAMLHCLSQSGTPVGISSVLSPTGLHLNGSFWTADYASRIATTDSPVECEYQTRGLFNQISQSIGNCEVIRNYICCDNNMMNSCGVKHGTWKEASRCNVTNALAVLPPGDYWLTGAFGYQNYTCTGGSWKNLDRCGMVDVNGIFQLVRDCGTSHYSFCKVGNNTGSDLSVCGSTLTTNQPSSNTSSTFISQKTEALSTTIMPINENTSTESLVRSHASSSSGTTVQQQTETLTTTIMSINEKTSIESIVNNHASSSADFKTGTTVQQRTETLTAAIMSLNENTSTESIVRNHASSSSDFKTRRTVQEQTETFTATNMPTNENTSTASIVRSQASSSSEFKTRTVQQQTQTLTATMMSTNENTSTESTVRNHASSSSVSGLGIGLGVSLSIVVIVIVTTLGVCVYKRRYRRKTDNSQVSVRMNALYDDSGQNETPIKPEHTNESYVYAVPSRLRKNDGNRHGENGIGNEFADLKAYSKAITSTQKDATKVDEQSRKDKNTDFAGYSIVIKNKDHHGLRHVNGNKGVMSNDYDGVDFSDAHDVQPRKEKHTGYAGDSTIIKTDDAGVMSNDYDGVDFSDVQDVQPRKEKNTGYAGDSTIIKTDDAAVMSNDYDGVDFSDVQDVHSRTENNTGLAGNSSVIKTDDAAVMSNEYDGVDFSDEPDKQSRNENNTGFAGDSTVIKIEDAAVMSENYDGFNFSAAPDPVNMNVYGHLGYHNHEDAYDIASCAQTQQTPAGMNDYDRVDVNR